MPDHRNKPRWMAWVHAKLTGAWWVPCPVCGDGFAAFEAHYGHGVNHKVMGYGDTSYELVCCKDECVNEAVRQSITAKVRMRREQDF